MSGISNSIKNKEKKIETNEEFRRSKIISSHIILLGFTQRDVGTHWENNTLWFYNDTIKLEKINSFSYQ
jgi:hypothetical protein